MLTLVAEFPNALRQDGLLYLLDTDREKAMGLVSMETQLPLQQGNNTAAQGRAYTLPPVRYGEVYVHESLSVALGVGVGDTVYVTVDMDTRHAMSAMYWVGLALRGSEWVPYGAQDGLASWAAANDFSESSVKKKHYFNDTVHIPLMVAAILPNSLGKRTGVL